MNELSPFSCIQWIAERKIQEAQAAGAFDNLPGAGRPLVLEDTRNVPPELRMAWKVLKNAGCLPPEMAARREIASLLDLLDNCPDEREQARCIQKARLILSRLPLNPGRHMSLEASDQYYERVLEKLATHEERLKRRGPGLKK